MFGIPEEWRPVPGAPGYYVSWKGEVKGPRVGMLSSSENSNGYLMVSIGGWKPVHQIVAVAFLGPKPEGCEVDHINGDRKDNSLENLRYVTHEENVRNGKNAKLTMRKARNIRKRYVPRCSKNGMRALAKLYGIDYTQVWNVVKGKSWKEKPPR